MQQVNESSEACFSTMRKRKVTLRAGQIVVRTRPSASLILD